ncbi:hypothetical protein THAOC_27792 [Thalassiosira oceanica]|uniref:Uncharacterized protein n=1 Tax=Thalassiosira oceanica TaxID=159749 RepID=K0RGM3_THAOC|nr:hypothetical protein THAOC_27792 [Thalassiosira oceanica]|eukprot:EJK52883.1 hypothetical protein THAOC_27792 [Thalassiosira oceanica]
MFWADAVGTATRSNPNDGRREKSAARGDRGPWFSREGRSQPSEGVRRRTARFWKAEIKAVPTVPSTTYGSGFCIQNYVLYLKMSLRAALFGGAQAKRYKGRTDAWEQFCGLGRGPWCHNCVGFGASQAA